MEYKHDDFIVDFTDRIKLAFDRSRKDRKEFLKHNVTLMLTFATPCFLVPYDRLKDDMTPDYPRVFDDTYRDLWKKIKNNTFFSQKKPTLSADLNAEEERPKFGISKTIQGAIEDFNEGVFNRIEEVKQPDNAQIISTIRNGLAHGNIFTTKSAQNGNGRKEIKEIMLAALVSSKNKEKGWKCLVITPSHFEKLLENWFTWLQDEGMYVKNKKQRAR